MIRKFVSEAAYMATFIFVWCVIDAHVIEPYIDVKAYVAAAGALSLIVSSSVARYVRGVVLSAYDDVCG